LLDAIVVKMHRIYFFCDGFFQCGHVAERTYLGFLSGEKSRILTPAGYTWYNLKYVGKTAFNRAKKGVFLELPVPGR